MLLSKQQRTSFQNEPLSFLCRFGIHMSLNFIALVLQQNTNLTVEMSVNVQRVVRANSQTTKTTDDLRKFRLLP